MNSISDNFTTAMSNPASKAEFLKQFENIVRGVEDSLIKQKNNILLPKTIEVDKLKAQHQEVIICLIYLIELQMIHNHANFFLSLSC